MAFCERCGREYKKRTPCQRLCYETCVPVVVDPLLYDFTKIHYDCAMYRDNGQKAYCSGLQQIYCAYGECRFYKREE